MATPPPQPPQTFRNVYTPEQFSTEILCGNRTVWWVREQCRKGKIKTVTKRPFLIPQSEAVRFVNPPPDKRPSW